VLYTAEGIRWSNGFGKFNSPPYPGGVLHGKALSATEAQAINDAQAFVITYPDFKHGDDEPEPVSVGPERLNIHKPVRERETEIGFDVLPPPGSDDVTGGHNE
jgi:hypothetical protein